MAAAAAAGFLLVRFVLRQKRQARAQLAEQAAAKGWSFRDQSSGTAESLVFVGNGWTIRTARSTATAGAPTTLTGQATIRFTAPALAAPDMAWGMGRTVGPELPPGLDLAGLLANPLLQGMLAMLPGGRDAFDKALEFQQNSQPVAFGSAALQHAIPLRARPGTGEPFAIDPALEQLFLEWPAPRIDPAQELSAYRDVDGLHVKLACHHSRLTWPVFEHLAALGEALMRAVPR